MKKTIKTVGLMLTAITIIFTTTAFAGIPQQSSSFYVADYSDVISQETEDYIVSKNAELEDLCGGQIVVVAVDFLDGMDIEDYCYKIFEEWGIGSSEENNGILLLLAIGEEDYWCMQGKGLESTLSSGEIGDILWNYLEDDFAAGNYDAGVRSVFDKLYSEVSSIYRSKSTGDVQNAFGGMKVFIIAFIIIAVILIICISKGSGSSTKRASMGYPPPPPRPRRPRRSSRPVPPPRRPSDDRHSPPPLSRSSSRTSSASRPTSRPSSSSRPSSLGRSSSGGMGRGGGGRSRGGGAGRSR